MDHYPTEFAKSRTMRVMRSNVVYVPTYPGANVPKAYQHFIFTCQRASVPITLPTWQRRASIFQTGVPTCQMACQFLNFVCQKACQFFNYFLKEYIFQYLNFSIMVNICKFQEYLGNSKKFILQNKELKLLKFACFFLHVINLVSLTYHSHHKSC